MSPSFSSRIKKIYPVYDDYIMGSTRIVKIDGKDFLVGSMIYAEEDTLDFTATFLISPLEAGPDINLPYPQQPLKQMLMIDSPVIAYKSYSPDDRSIVITNLAQKTPQHIINLGEF